MDTSVYRIRTDGASFICELQQQDDSWERVAFNKGEVYLTNKSDYVLMGEYWVNEKALLRVIESVLGSSVRRVREWRTV